MVKWQTRKIESLMRNSVKVQVLSVAPISGFSLVYKAAWSHNDANRETPIPKGTAMSVRRDG